MEEKDMSDQKKILHDDSNGYESGVTDSVLDSYRSYLKQ